MLHLAASGGHPQCKYSGGGGVGSIIGGISGASAHTLPFGAQQQQQPLQVLNQIRFINMAGYVM